MRFGMLGPLQVCDGTGVDVSLGGPNPQRIMAELLLADSNVVPVHRLVDAIWDGRPPVSARQNIQTYAWSLRRGLRAAEAGAARLHTESGGYRLRVAPDEFDVTVFERVTRSAAGQSSHRRVELLRAALRLWRGEALAGLRSGVRLSCLAARLDERRLRAWEDCLDAELAAGRHREVVLEIEDLASVHPERERVAALSMLALFRCGCRPEASAVYRRLRTAMIEQFGMEPARAIGELHRRILVDDQSLRTTAGGAPAMPVTPPAAQVA